jgi:thiol-disulfide isomerase/thioredoxin
MRRFHVALAAGLLTIALPAITQAQDTAKQDTPPTATTSLHADATHDSATPDPKAAPKDTPTQPDAPTSLGEIARLARAKKAAAQTKSVKIFDDDNMPRAPLTVGEKAPGFSSGSSSDGGKVTLIDFWATWCGPCRHALPGLKQLAAVYGGGNFELISVNEDDDEADWRAFVSQNGMTWTQRFDSGHQMMRQYGTNALPTYILIGKDGNVIQQYEGEDPGMPIIERAGPDIKKALSQRL